MPDPLPRRHGPGGRRRSACTPAVAQTDLDEQRAWERQRESDLAHMAGCTATSRLQAENDAFRAELRGNHKEFEDWRRYIHELEGKLGLPRSASRSRASRSRAAGEGLLPRQRPPALRGRRRRRRARAAPRPRPRLRHRARARPRAGAAELALRGARRRPRPVARGSAARALRRRRRDVVGDDVQPLRRPGRAPRLLRPVARGPLLQARPGRARRRGADARPARRVHHRGALDPADAPASCARARPVHFVRNGIDKRVFRSPPNASSRASTARCACSSRGIPACGSRACPTRWRACARCASRTT